MAKKNKGHNPPPDPRKAYKKSAAYLHPETRSQSSADSGSDYRLKRAQVAKGEREGFQFINVVPSVEPAQDFGRVTGGKSDRKGRRHGRHGGSGFDFEY